MQWEYKVLKRSGWFSSDGVIIALLNQMGQGGWELFHVEDKYLWCKRNITASKM